jgi:hypothetical protein
MSPTDPLAGYTGDTAYLRSADNEFQLMPGGRLQVDAYFFKRETDQMPTPSFLLRRARLELPGWVGRYFFFTIGGDFAAGAPAGADPVPQSWLATTDDYVGVAPWKTLAMLQVGQFDAPFTLENRTSDKYFDYMERSITVRAFGIPSNKETGAMVHGMLPSKAAYYSVGVFNGDGQNFRNTDSFFDFMGRAYVAPFAMAGMKSMEDIEIGGSFWTGKRGNNGLPLATQTTQGGLPFMSPSFSIPAAMAGGAATPVEVHQHGDLLALAAELHVPIMHRFGARVEYVHKKQDLGYMDATGGQSKLTLRTPGKLDGWSLYGEVWAWVVGDDTILPAPGLQLPSRLKKFETKAPKHGVMLALRVEHLDESINPETAQGSADTVSGNRRVSSLQFGTNYWYSKRFRASFNYAVNWFDGNAGQLTTLQKALGGNKSDHEFLFRLGIAL